MVIELSEADHEKVSKAISAAEATTDGEIVAVASERSDSYHDVALHWALLPLFAVLAWAAWRPSALIWWYQFLLGGWQPEPTLGQLLTLLLVFAALKFTVALLILKWMPLRLALTPGATKRPARPASGGPPLQGRRRAEDGKQGGDPDLSVDGRAAGGIVADEAITKVTTPEAWGEAMATLLADVRDGRPGDGICAAIQQIGIVLSEHFPRTFRKIRTKFPTSSSSYDAGQGRAAGDRLAGEYISALKRGRWEYVSRTGSTNAVVILAEHEGKIILIEQYRVPVGARSWSCPPGWWATRIQARRSKKPRSRSSRKRRASLPKA